MNSNLKKRMLIVILSVIGVIVLLAALLNVLTKCQNASREEETTDFFSKIQFSSEYVTDLDELLADRTYSDYDKTIYYYDPQTGITEGIDENKYNDYGPCVQLLANFVAAMMNGDSDQYNTFFSELYFRSNEPQEAFSMQKLYEIQVSPYSKTEKTGEDGRKYTEYIYALQYKIRKNNGSLRDDMDSDGLRPQYILITDREGSLLIDKIIAP